MLLALSVISRQSQRLGASSYRVFDERGGSIGRGKQADWQIDDPDAVLSGRHAAIRFIAGRFVLEDTSTNGTALNRADALVPKGQPVPLSDGDHIFLGDFELLVQVIPEAAPAPAPAAAMPPPVPAWPDPAGLGGAAQAPAWPAPPASPAPPAPEWPAPPGLPPAPAPSAWPSAPGPPGGGPAMAPWPAPPAAAPPPAVPPAWPATPAPESAPAWPPPAPAASPAPLIVGGWDDSPDAGSSGGLGGLVGAPPAPSPGALLDAPSPYGGAPGGYGAPAAPYPPPLGAPPAPMPGYGAPAAPVYGAPAPPAYGAPAPGAYGAPVAPAYGAPAAPVYGAPAAPAQGAPQGYAPVPPAYGEPAAAAYGAAPVAGAGATDLNALFAAIGIDPSQVPPDTAAQLGTILRTVTHGLIDVLKARAEVKNQFRMSVTYIKPVENNPLKFARDPEDALHTLFVKRNPGYVGPVEAFHEAFEDLGRHQIAMLAGMQAAFAAVLKRFDPGQIEAACEKSASSHKGLLGGVGKPKYWEFFREHFQRIAEDSDSAFQEFFGQAFVRAYDDQIHRLEEAARQRRR